MPHSSRNLNTLGINLTWKDMKSTYIHFLTKINSKKDNNSPEDNTEI